MLKPHSGSARDALKGRPSLGRATSRELAPRSGMYGAFLVDTTHKGGSKEEMGRRLSRERIPRSRQPNVPD